MRAFVIPPSHRLPQGELYQGKDITEGARQRVLVHSEVGGLKRGQDRNKTDLKSCIYNAFGSAKYSLLLLRMFSASADIQV